VGGCLRGDRHRSQPRRNRNNPTASKIFLAGERLVLAISLVLAVIALVRKRQRTFGLHLVVPLIGFVMIAYVLANADINAKIGGLAWLVIGVVVIGARKLTGRAITLTQST
jgi:uncharacterized membrane-anchored protein